MITIYVSGPMTGLPKHNIPAFEYATQRLRDAGLRVLSPHEGVGTKLVLFLETQGVKLTKEMIYRICLPGDAAMVADSDYIVCLPGYENSNGGAWEINGGVMMGVKTIRPQGSPSLEDWITAAIEFLQDLSLAKVVA